VYNACVCSEPYPRSAETVESAAASHCGAEKKRRISVEEEHYIIGGIAENSSKQPRKGVTEEAY